MIHGIEYIVTILVHLLPLLRSFLDLLLLFYSSLQFRLQFLSSRNQQQSKIRHRRSEFYGVVKFLHLQTPEVNCASNNCDLCIL